MISGQRVFQIGNNMHEGENQERAWQMFRYTGDRRAAYGSGEATWTIQQSKSLSLNCWETVKGAFTAQVCCAL